VRVENRERGAVEERAVGGGGEEGGEGEEGSWDLPAGREKWEKSFHHLFPGEKEKRKLPCPPLQRPNQEKNLGERGETI